jgi:hypothetical protein
MEADFREQAQGEGEVASRVAPAFWGVSGPRYLRFSGRLAFQFSKSASNLYSISSVVNIKPEGLGESSGSDKKTLSRYNHTCISSSTRGRVSRSAERVRPCRDHQGLRRMASARHNLAHQSCMGDHTSNLAFSCVSQGQFGKMRGSSYHLSQMTHAPHSRRRSSILCLTDSARCRPRSWA